MKKLVWVAGLILLVSLVFPNGPKLPSFNAAVVRPVVADAPVAADIVKLLSGATAADRARIYDVYTSLKTVLQRPTAPDRITTTEKWEELHGHTLELAIDQVNKYPGLDVAIENVFKTTVGTDDVLPGNPETLKKLGEACDIVASSVVVAK
ncbi:hypothetical protein EBZ39_02470 [bacterium]|nr:hypothetical protein [bacterium]